jgi:hypothetical protein
VPIKQRFLDHTTAENSAELSRRIERFWHDRGHKKVRAWAETVKLMHGEVRDAVATIYCVRSNLIRGLPATVVPAE